MFSWLKRRRRKRILAEPFPEAWLAYLRANVVQYSLLMPGEQVKLRDRVQVFVAEKTWVGCGGLTVDDEMKVTVAGQACLLVVGIDYEYHYDKIQSVLIYPDTYLHPPDMHGQLVHEGSPVYGEAWHRGPIVLSWKNTRSLPEEGGNLVFHEFAHHLDDLDGDMDGMPPLERAQVRQWDRVVEKEYRRLVRASQRGRATLLNQYGASSRAEFFAVATECFFERPVALRERHPELYDVLRGFYRQDPAEWPWDTAPASNDASRKPPRFGAAARRFSGALPRSPSTISQTAENTCGIACAEMILRSKGVRIEGATAAELQAELKLLLPNGKPGLLLSEIRKVLHRANPKLAVAQIEEFTSLLGTYKMFDGDRLLAALMRRVSPKDPAIVPTFLNAMSNRGHVVVVDKVFVDRSGRENVIVSLRDPASGTRHLVRWDDFEEATADAVRNSGALFTDQRTRSGGIS